jgi:D-serine deaminase-like pyridoxal phosphate-dependent protein
MNHTRPVVPGARHRVRDQYGTAIGQRREDLLTPALVLDLSAAHRNMATMSAALKGQPAGIRPHIKVHKSPDLALLQMEAGALGVCTATIWEAAVMAEVGIDDIFVVNTITDERKLRLLCELARQNRVRVAVDSVEGLTVLAEAATATDVTVGVMIEVDTGMDRGGVDTVEEGVALARVVTQYGSVRLDGVTGYEGHCSLTPERELRHERQQAAIGFLVEVADAIEDDGIPCQVISAGGTATWDWTASHPRMTEIQAGTYVVIDAFHGAMVQGFDCALTVQTDVIGAPRNRIITDAGSKAIGDGDLSRIVGDNATVVRFDEEHGIYQPERASHLVIGDSVAVIPGYAPSTVNWFDAFHVVEDGRVVDVWPVVPRGPGNAGILATHGVGSRG